MNSRDHDTGVHTDISDTIVYVASVVRDDVLENKNGLAGDVSTATLKHRGELTKLPARPPAIRATPMKRTTRALHAAGPSLPQESPEKAELRCDLSSSDVTRNPTTSETPSVVTSSRRHLGNDLQSANPTAQALVGHLGQRKDEGTTLGYSRVEQIAGIQSTNEMCTGMGSYGASGDG